MIFSPSSSVLPFVQSKRVRALAITSTRRHPSVPDVETLIEAGIPDFDARNWIALFAPAGMSPDVVNRLNAEINRIVQTPTMIERFTAVGAEPLQGTPKQWAAYVREEASKWAKVIKSAGVRLD